MHSQCLAFSFLAERGSYKQRSKDEIMVPWMVRMEKCEQMDSYLGDGVNKPQQLVKCGDERGNKMWPRYLDVQYFSLIQ